MGKKYIIELLDDCQSEFKGIMVFGLTQEKQISVELIPEESLTPYTEPDIEQVRKEAYKEGREAGIKDGMCEAWEAARKIASDNAGRNYSIFGQHFTVEILNTHSASEAIEEIRAYEQAQKEKEEQEQEQSFTAEEVMRQYLDTFCKGKSCTGCPLHTPDFTCGRGYHFITKNPISDEEVRRAYAEVLQKMKE